MDLFDNPFAPGANPFTPDAGSAVSTQQQLQDTQRRQRFAQALMMHASQPQGGYVGNVDVAPSPLSSVARAATLFGGMYANQQLAARKRLLQTPGYNNEAPLTGVDA